MKTTILFFLLTLGMLGQEVKKTPIAKRFDGKVKYFAKTNKDFSNNIIDTTVGQARKILLATDHSLFEIKWELEGAPELFAMEYYIEKVYFSTNFNNTEKTGNHRYINYLGFDKDHYPMLFMLSEDLTHCYIYYFWDSEEKSFKKSEKVIFDESKEETLWPNE